MSGKIYDFLSENIPGIIGIFLIAILMVIVGTSCNLKRLHKPLDEWE